MTKRKDSIIKIFDKFNEHDYKNIVIFTKCFKIIGEIENKYDVDDVVTLKNIRVYSVLGDCECETATEYKEFPWLNVFCEDITAFAFIA